MSKLPVTHLFDTIRSRRGAGLPHWVGERLWRLNGDGGRASIDGAELARAIGRAFDSRCDRVLGLPWPAAPTPWHQPTWRRRIDLLHPQGKLNGAKGAEPDAAGRDPRTGGGGLSAAACDLNLALGLAQARDTLGQDHWIVVVSDSDEPGVPLSPAQLDALEQLRRFLIVYCEPCDAAPRANGHPSPRTAVAADPLCRQLTSLEGLTWWGPVGGIEPEGLVSVLEALKELEKPAVLHVRLKAAEAAPLAPDAQAAVARAPHVQPHGANGALGRLPGPTVVEAAGAALARLAAADDRVVGVSLSSPVVMSALARQAPRRFFEVPVAGRNSLAWCAGLAVGGCRPFVSLTSDAVTDAWGHIVREICEPGLPVTLLISQSSAASANRTGGVLATLRLLPNAMVMVPASTCELEAMVVCAAAHDGPAIVWLPAALERRLRRDVIEAVAVAKAARLRQGDKLASSAGPSPPDPSPEPSNPLSLEWTGASRDGIDDELEQVRSLALSTTIEPWVRAYELHGRRDLYLWKWCRRGIELTTLPCVRADLRAHVNDTKLLGVMLDVLLDDVADLKRDKAFLEHLIGLLDGHEELAAFSREQRGYAKFTLQVWQAIWERAKEYPDFAAFEELLRYDYLQLFNTMRYSSLVNRHLALLNDVEHELYFPHNMHMMIFSTLDLMCAQRLDTSELGQVREAMWHAQCMGEIGNQVTTWQRELAEGDYTSGVFASALTRGDLTVQQLAEGDRRRIADAIRRGGHERRLLDRWNEHRRRLLALASHIRSFDVVTVARGLDRLMLIELGSRGLR